MVSPDKFAGTLTAVEAAEAIAEGWLRTSPHDEILTAPLADGGPGFVNVLHKRLGGELLAVTVRGPLGDPVPATVLRVGAAAYIEAAQACGLNLLPMSADGHTPVKDVALGASTYGVGELLGHAIDAGATSVTVGLGGSGTNDGGAGLLAALGAVSEPDDALTGGPNSLARLTALDLAAARRRVEGIELIAASDVDNPLLSLRGATSIFGAQKGIVDIASKLAADAALARLADLADRLTADAAGAGAAGGLGYALQVLGARRVPGFGTVADAVGIAELVMKADLVITGEGKLDWSSMDGKVVTALAALASPAMRPCIALAGVVEVGNRELRANGLEAAYSVADAVGLEASLAEPARNLAALAERVAKTWSRR